MFTSSLNCGFYLCRILICVFRIIFEGGSLLLVLLRRFIPCGLLVLRNLGILLGLILSILGTLLGSYFY